jgi:hypothetical protein
MKNDLPQRRRGAENDIRTNDILWVSASLRLCGRNTKIENGEVI